jgi:hypothetical protein
MIYKSQLIIDNQKAFIEKCYIASNKIKDKFNQKDTTWIYNEYNIFSVTAGCPLFYSLFFELQRVIKEYYLKPGPLWMQAWLNFHKQDEVLDWHDHEWPFHGYISIDPKNTSTIFKTFEVTNEIGNIYIGPGNLKHKVVVHEKFETPRITIGFDVTNEIKYFKNMFSLIPIIN